MTGQVDYHHLFHQILGRLTTIRSACSVLVEDYQAQVSPEVYEMLKVVNDHATGVIKEIEELKEKVYKETDNKANS